MDWGKRLKALVVLALQGEEGRSLPSGWSRVGHFLDQKELEDTKGSDKGPRGLR